MAYSVTPYECGASLNFVKSIELDLDRILFPAAHRDGSPYLLVGLLGLGRKKGGALGAAFFSFDCSAV
jgi:hypothetical protein